MKKSVFVFLFLIVLVPFLSIVSAGIGAEAGQTAFKQNIVPGIIEAEDFDNGGDGKAYYDTTGNETGSNRTYRNERVDLNSFSSASNKLSVGWTKRGEWLEYTINVTETGIYNLNLNSSHASSNQAKIYFLLDGLNITSPISLPNTGSWSSFRNTKSSQNFYLTQGTHILTVYMMTEGSGWIGNLDYFDLQLVDQNSNCNVFWNVVFTANHNSTGMVHTNPNNFDYRFLCYSGRLYECGWELSNSNFAYKMANDEVIAGWKCDLSSNKSSFIGFPFLDRPSSNTLNYSSTYSFSLRNDKNYQGDYSILWRYNAYDGSYYDVKKNYSGGTGPTNLVSFSEVFSSPSSFKKF